MVSFDAGSASKVDDVTALPSRHKMADMLLWQRYDNNKMAEISNPNRTFKAEFKCVSSFSPSPTVCL